MRPSDALAYKLLCHEMAKDLWTDTRTNISEDSDQETMDLATIHWFARNLTQQTDHTYFVSGEMAAVMAAACRSFPGMTRLETHLATPSGFMVYETPIAHSTGKMTGEAAAWALEEQHAKLLGDGQIAIPVQGFMWDTTAVTLPDESVQPGVVVAFMVWVRHDCLYPLAWNTLPFGDPVDLTPKEGDGIAFSEVEPQFWTTQLLMQQTLAWVESARAGRPERRRWVRAGLPPPSNLKIVQLRRMAKAPDDDQEKLVDWSHRWLVSGHWRQQYYPSTRDNRPVWISPHVKGPEHKPLVVKDKVTAWVR